MIGITGQPPELGRDVRDGLLELDDELDDDEADGGAVPEVGAAGPSGCADRSSIGLAAGSDSWFTWAMSKRSPNDSEMTASEETSGLARNRLDSAVCSPMALTR